MPFFGSRIEGRALDCPDWARAGGYACHRVPGVELVGQDLKRSTMPYVWNEVRKDALALEERGFHLAKASPCYALVHNGPTTYQMLFSSADDLYAEDVEWLPVPIGEGTLAGGNVRHVHDLAHQRFTFDLSAAKDVVEIKEPHLYIRSPYNFGHWVLDYLSTLLIAHHVHPELAELPLALSFLLDYQKALFHALGFEDDRLHVLPVPKGQSRMFRFDNLFVPSSGRSPLGCALVRNKVAEIPLPSYPKGSRRIFLSRRRFFPRHRIANQDEVEALLAERGFDILHPEHMDPLELLSRVRDAEMIALTFGAGTGNLAMSPPHCQFLYMAPEFFVADRFDSTLLRGLRRYLLPFYNRIQLLPGQPNGDSQGSHYHEGKLFWDLATLDAPFAYDIRAIDQAVMNAEKNLARTKSVSRLG